MTLSAYLTLKSVFDKQGCRALTFALARLSCYYSYCHGQMSVKVAWAVQQIRNKSK